jgi:hypothetical protein
MLTNPAALRYLLVGDLCERSRSSMFMNQPHSQAIWSNASTLAANRRLVFGLETNALAIPALPASALTKFK